MKFEPNHKRKSHRLSIPIQAVIDQKTYRVLDWSATGLNIAYTPRDIHTGDTLEISLLLPTREAAIILKITAIVRNEYADSYGMEIVEISDKNHRVLRHYATLAIEGNLDHIDDLSSNLFMTDVQTPLKEPVLLTDKEDQEIHTLFLKKLFYIVLFALLFFTIVFFTFLQHYLVVCNSNGIVTGNAQVYQAPYDGRIKKVYVSQGEHLSPGQLLFEMDIKGDKRRLSYYMERQEQLKKQRKEHLHLLETLRERLHRKQAAYQEIRRQKKAYLDAQYAEKKHLFDKAASLYRDHFITYVKYQEINNAYEKFMKEYLQVKGEKDTDRELSGRQQEVLKIEDQILSTQRMIHSIDTHKEQNTLAALALKEKIAQAMVLAKERGVIYTLMHHSGDSVKFTEGILVAEVRKKPYILTQIPAEKAADIYRGKTCLLYDSRRHATFTGTIVAMGDEMLKEKTGSMKENVPVRIEVETNDIELKFNHYVKVYFLNDSDIAQSILRYLPEGMIVK